MGEHGVGGTNGQAADTVNKTHSLVSFHLYSPSRSPWSLDGNRFHGKSRDQDRNWAGVGAALL